MADGDAGEALRFNGRCLIDALRIVAKGREDRLPVLRHSSWGAAAVRPANVSRLGCRSLLRHPCFAQTVDQPRYVRKGGNDLIEVT